MCTSRKYPYSPYRRDWNFQWGGGFCKSKKFKDVWSFIAISRGVEESSVGEVRIFSGTTVHVCTWLVHNIHKHNLPELPKSVRLKPHTVQSLSTQLTISLSESATRKYVRCSVTMLNTCLNLGWAKCDSTDLQNDKFIGSFTGRLFFSFLK